MIAFRLLAVAKIVIIFFNAKKVFKKFGGNFVFIYFCSR